MSKVVENLLALEQQMESVESEALDEEQDNAERTYESLKREYDSAYIPNPDVSTYSTGTDYPDISDVQGKKKSNESGRKQQDILSRYSKNPRIHIGHLQLASGKDCFFTDSPELDTKTLSIPGQDVILINTEDRRYSHYVSRWRYPSEYSEVTTSRNISMYNYKVKGVDIVLDKRSVITSNITDSYLRKALTRNKGNKGIQSIIQTIQRKQDDIRQLPVYQSFIVQGCAGSGKTMVLLHRLRYLIFNKELDAADYILLVPSNNFKSFIKDISREFRINFRSIFTLQSYYRMLLGKQGDETSQEADELVFGADYLARVYSKQFMQECYRSVFTSLLEKANALIEFCEERLNGWINDEAEALDKEIQRIQSDVIVDAQETVKHISEYSYLEIRNIDAIEALVKEIETKYFDAKEQYDHVIIPEEGIVISPDDIRIQGNTELSMLKGAIENEKKALVKASIFTLSSHKRKLEKLEEQYERTYRAFESLLIENDKQAYAEQASRLQYVYDHVTLGETEQILTSLRNTLGQAESQLAVLRERKRDFEAYIGDKYKEEIRLLNSMIDTTSSVADDEQNFSQNLSPAYHFFARIIRLAGELLNSFDKGTLSQEKGEASKRFRFFTKRTEPQLKSFLSTMLFNTCAKKIKTEFGIKICNIYKHYWYISLYCQFLLGQREFKEYRYIYIDEAQDWSATELDLVFQINTCVEDEGEFSRAIRPVMNIFGDVNQTITKHGLLSWDGIDYIPQRYQLNENFRNTNQIIDYCNDRLPFLMEKVGVNMEGVSEYGTLDEAKRRNRDFFESTVCVVKDEYAKADLENLFKTRGIPASAIYTIKEVKGLEFKYVCVFDREMTQNERYIAYTRALVKLYVIKSLQHMVDSESKLYVEGDEVEDA